MIGYNNCGARLSRATTSPPASARPLDVIADRLGNASVTTTTIYSRPAELAAATTASSWTRAHVNIGGEGTCPSLQPNPAGVLRGHSPHIADRPRSQHLAFRQGYAL